MRNRSRVTRRRVVVLSLVAVGTLLLTACTGGSGGAVATVTRQVTAPGHASSSGSPGAGSAAAPTAGQTSGRGSTGSSANPGVPASGVPANDNGGVPAGGTEPDGFKITKLKRGEKAPQFIVFSFDGTGWDAKWQYWFGIMQKVPLHFTGFLSGTYMLSDATKDKYTGPGHATGKSSIPWDAPSDIPVEINNLNKSISLGNEVGTHFNGHFCDDNVPGGNQWDSSDWNNELDQFFSLVRNVDVNNGITAKLNIAAAEIKGERTPCLTGHKADLYPALEAHGMDYDSSFTRTGLSWPVKSADGKIWEMGMSEFPMHGTGHPQITMDYNFYAQQEPDTVAGGAAPSPAKSAADSAQVLATYEDMLKAAQTDGVNEPLIIGNHFNDWNNNAYSNAVGNFALAECGKTGVHCVPFRDLVDWMNAQDPAVLKALQNHQSNLGGCPYLKWPKCDGLIRY
ncbi:hypothetical protein SAMN04515671_1209 [Nakamurella panacisegetis]|uniref:Polysaccharide deacetylase n=1 Tax=Nakamurella panacisegetis TaxID=1090615 RepID=A0A1H0K8M9_9ACTN|nr:polysaccharide deacetylase [Nakamurella panacisegetis]SDO52244.1 hypothetical protein SAMN04515671_1209 [Nakamurella panacisegetis]